MLYNLEELEKRCRRYHARRLLFFVLAFLAIALPLMWAVWQFQTKDTLSPKQHTKDANLTKSERNTTIKANCFALQMLYSKEKFRANVEKERERLQEAGLDCYLKSGKTLEDGSKELFLRCNAVATKEEIKPFLKVAKLLNKSAYVINEECRFAKKYVIVPKVIESAPPRKKSPPKEESSQRVTDNMMVANELIDAKEADVGELENLFAKRQSYDLAIKIARAYYAKKSYKEALQWAKKANKLDRDKEEAWILYAKSLYALGKKEQAKNILRLYLEYRNSDKAQKLLREWR